MSHWATEHVEGVRQERLILLVVGAHLEAELAHRPMAYRMLEHMRAWIDQAGEELTPNSHPPNQPLVCTDLWYVNNEDLFEQPVVAIGPPGFNAASALLSLRLPPAFVVDESMHILMDVEDPRRGACLWGADVRSTAAAVDAFIQRYLCDFMTRATGRESAQGA